MSDSNASSSQQPAAGRTPGGGRTRRWSSHVAALVRWLHLYLSMFGLATLLFFSVTGVTLNHPEWFPANKLPAESAGTLPAEWLRGDSGSSDNLAVRELEIVERLRARHAIRGAVTEIRVDDGECVVTFKGPGYAADAFIQRNDGSYALAVSQSGLIAVLNDLHKGRDSGRAWAWVIDISALLMTLAAVTGLILLFYIRRRRAAGLLVALAGTLVLIAAFCWLVP